MLGEDTATTPLIQRRTPSAIASEWGSNAACSRRMPDVGRHYRHLPLRPAPTLTAVGTAREEHR